MAWEYVVTLKGSNNAPRNLTYKLVAADYATAVADQAIIKSALEAVTAAVVTRERLSEVTELSPALPSNVDTAIIATIGGRIDGTQKPVTIRWPAPVAGVRQGTEGEEYNEVDLSDATVQTYWGLFRPTTGKATISDGETVSANPTRSQIVSQSSRNP